MKHSKRYFACLLLLGVVGCSGEEPEQESSVMPTVAPVPSATSTSAGSAASSSAVEARSFTPEEMDYINLAMNTVERINKANNSLTDLNSVAGVKAAVSQVVADYSPVNPPPPFVAADSLMRSGLDRMTHAMSLADNAVLLKSESAMRDASVSMRESGKILSDAMMELERVRKVRAGTP